MTGNHAERHPAGNDGETMVTGAEHRGEHEMEGGIGVDGDDVAAHDLGDPAGTGGGVDGFDAAGGEPGAEQLGKAKQRKRDAVFLGGEVGLGEDPAELAMVIDDGKTADSVL
jgi:hypothetical protein